MRKFLLLILLLATALAQADDPTESQDFKDVLKAIEGEKYIQVRTIAESRLRENQDDALGLYLLSLVYQLEGNAPRTYLYAGKATKAFELVLKDQSKSTKGDLQLHQSSLQTRISSAMEMGEYEEGLELIEQHDKLYKDVSLESMAGWPLLKLGRVEECRRRMQAVADKGEPFDKIVALNTLGALAWELGETEKSRDMFLELKETVVANNLQLSTVYLCNKAESEVGLGNFKTAEKDYIEAEDYLSREEASNPYQGLANLYTDQARYTSAIESTKSMFFIHKQRLPQVRAQTWVTVRKQLASVLLATGYAEKAAEVLEPLLNRPERNYGTSDDPYRLESELLILYQECLIVELQKSAEENSWSSFGHRLRNLPRRWSRSNQVDEARLRVACLISQNNALDKVFLPYQADWVGSPWLLSSLVHCFGPGVAGVQLSEQLERTENDKFKPYLQGYLGESLVAQGRYAEAIEQLEKADNGLPKEMVLLKLRVKANLGLALEKTGKIDSALGHYQRVLETDPGTFRRMAAGIPVQFKTDNSSAAEAARSMLESSPRFRSEDYGFIIELSESAGGLKGKLLDPAGSSLAWAYNDKDNSEDTSAISLCREFHNAVFAPRVKLSEADIAKIQNPGDS
jgi:tetratricopeptide (TPR) repeat protein